MATTVHVKNISPTTTEAQVHDFFSFCGKIQTLTLTPADGAQAAAVSFEKATAAKTALLLDNTQLGPNLVNVSAAASLEEMTSPKSATAPGLSDEVEQEDKPRSRIFAEYLAHGYTISDKAIERALALDQQHGISSRFTQALANFDNKYGATEKARGLDQQYGVTERAMQGWRGMNTYFEKALETPSGQRVRSFYMEGQKQVLDVHGEARRLADIKAGKNPDDPVANIATAAAPHDPVPGGSAGTVNAPEPVPGTDGKRTQCECGGASGGCPCEEGKCACAGCAKNPGTV